MKISQMVASDTLSLSTNKHSFRNVPPGEFDPSMPWMNTCFDRIYDYSRCQVNCNLSVEPTFEMECLGYFGIGISAL